MAKIIELILSEDTRGSGTPKNPSRRVVQLWTKDGALVIDHDPCGKHIEGDTFEAKDFVNLSNI